MRLRIVGGLLGVLFSMAGCADSPEVAAIDQAREDFGCEDVVVRGVDPEPSRKACPPMVVFVQACAQYAAYACTPGVRDCDYTCRRLGRDDPRAN
jgi:hypothetical protein